MKSTLRVRKKGIRKKQFTKKPGSLVIVGGREDKNNHKAILKDIADRVGSGTLIIATAATEAAEESWQDYQQLFRGLGVRHVQHLQISSADDAKDPALKKLFKNAAVVFFTGGDQLRITTKIGGTPLMDYLFKLYKDGGTIAGTSAGASMMGKTMLIGGGGEESHKIGNWNMAPGLGFLDNVIIDQHFAQRGRIGRLLGAVALNPAILGIGIDEDTAIIVNSGHFRVIGSNAVYVIDGHTVSHTNVAEDSGERTMSMHDVTLHILAPGEHYDFCQRKILKEVE